MAPVRPWPVPTPSPGKKAGGGFGKLLWKLKVRAVSGIWEQNQSRVRKFLLKDE
jgi:hypothetical protein